MYARSLPNMSSRIASVLLLVACASSYAAAGEQCPSGWTHRVQDDKCYRYFSYAQGDTELSYAGAVAACQGLHAELVVPQSKDLNNFLINLMRGKGHYTWLAATDITKEGVWVREDSKPLSWTNWKSGNPTNYSSYYGELDCAVIDQKDGSWMDRYCLSTNEYICEKRSPVQLSFNITADATNISMTCQVSGSSHLLATFMQIVKVNHDGSETPLVELIPGSQQPFYTDDDFIRRSHVAGNLDVRQGQVYLKVDITQPVWRDAG